MKRNNPNSSDKNRNNNNSTSNNNSNRNRSGKDSNNISKDCTAFKCKVASSCTSANKTVQDIERYTREAENLVEALSALTKLAEQLKPCIPTKSQCSQRGSYYHDGSSESSSIEENKYVSSFQKDIEEQDSEPKLNRPKRRVIEQEEDVEPTLTKRHVVHVEETKIVSKVRSEPERVKTIEETNDYCLCHCSSLQQHKLTSREDEEEKEKKKRERDSDDDKSVCCLRKKSSCCSKKKTKEKQPKIVEEIVELKPLPMPSMTVVEPVEEPARMNLQPALTYEPPIDERVTIYPTVPALTTKAAMNLEDKEMQTSLVCDEKTEMGSMTEPVQFAGGGVNKACATTCCTTGCGTVDTRDVGTVKDTVTLNAIPFEEYAEKDFYQYWYNEAVNCKCPSEMDIVPIPPPPPPNDPIVQTPISGSHSPHPEPKRQQQPYLQQQQPQPHQSMMDCYPYYHGGQQPPTQSVQYQHVPHRQVEYTEYGYVDSKGSRPLGINAVNYNPPARMVYRSCRPNGLGIESDLDCEPSCLSTTGTNRVGAPSNTASNAPSVGQAEYGSSASKKTVQYQDKRYNSYIAPQTQGQQNLPNSYAPCYENIPQRPGMVGRQQETYPANRNAPRSGMRIGAYETQLNNIVGKHYNTLFVDKADKDLEESLKNGRPATKGSRTNSAADPGGQCSGSCTYQVKPKDGNR